ncbi:MAG: hypothetical protein ACK5MK_03520 [Dysgonomonas sp.]
MGTAKNAIIIGFTIVFMFASCGQKQKDSQAQTWLNDANELYKNGLLDGAKQKLASIDSIYPNAFKQRKEGLVLLQKIRKQQNDLVIAHSDSILTVLQPKLEELKKQFIFQKDAKYQIKGVFVPKNDPSLSGNATGLRSGVIEGNNIFIESVYLGGQRHASMKLTTKDGKSSETKNETGDGLNYRSGNVEIIRFTKMTENGIVKFISENRNIPITVTLQGKQSTSYLLSNASKLSIKKSLQLSDLMTEIENAQIARYKAISLNDYLKEKQDSIAATQAH